MKPIVEKVLSSGLIDRSMAELMEKYHLLPEGAAEQVKDATREQMERAVAEAVEIAEREQLVKETRLDLDKLRWPTKVKIVMAQPAHDRTTWLDAVIDRMGRYFFRFQDVEEKWFVPGYRLHREGFDVHEIILESQVIYIDELPVAVQVTTQPA